MTPDDAEEYTQSLAQIGGGLWRQILWAQRTGVPAALGLSLRDWVDKRLGGYVRMAVEERKQVHKTLTALKEDGGEGLTQREAAQVTGAGLGTVNADLNSFGSERRPHKSAGDGTENAPCLFDSEPDELPDPAIDRTEEIQELARQHQPAPVAESPPLPAERFACIVIDPPWPMPKIERKTRAWQGTAIDYPVMKLADIAALPLAELADDNCHLYLWVTHKFLPAGLGLLDNWGFRYQCLMTWNKNTGIVPYSWMYDTEHVLFATRGRLRVQKRGLRLSFDEPVNGHSSKPDIFYERVRHASPGPRLEMFARRERDGFTAWGNEVTDAP